MQGWRREGAGAPRGRVARGCQINLRPSSGCRQGEDRGKIFHGFLRAPGLVIWLLARFWSPARAVESCRSRLENVVNTAACARFSGGDRREANMKLWICLIVCLLLPSTAFAFQNEPTGFRGISWGTPLSAVQSQMIPDAGDLYNRINDKLKLGDAALMGISYEFDNGRFSQVIIFSKEGLNNEKTMITAFFAHFGSVPAAHEGLYIWTGSVGAIYLICGPEGGHQNHGCHAFIGSTVAWQQKQADEAAKRALQLNKDF